MIRGGFIEHWREEFWPSADRCSETATGGDDGSFIPAISVSDAQGSFYLLFIGKLIYPLFQSEVFGERLRIIFNHTGRLWISCCSVHR